MNRLHAKWFIPAAIPFLLVCLLWISTDRVDLANALLNAATGLLASVGAVMALARLSLGSLSPRQRAGWQLALVTLALVALGEFCEPFTAATEQRLGIDDLDDILTLMVAPIALWLLARLEPLPRLPQRWVLLGFVLQAGAMVLDLIDDGGVGASGFDPAHVTTYADLTQSMSVFCYLLAASWTVLDARRRFIEETDQANPYISRPGGIRDRSYPPPFILGRHLPDAATPAGRVHRLCNDALWRPGDMLGDLRNVALIASWPLVAAVRAVKATRVHGEAVWKLTAKTQLGQFIEQVSLAVRHRIPPTYYYVFELYRGGQRRRAGQYLMRYATKEIAYRLLYPIATGNSSPTPLKNKLEFAAHCRRNGLRHVAILMAFEDGDCKAGLGLSARLPQHDFFVKPIFGKGGVGTERWSYLGWGHYRNSRGRFLDAAELLMHLAWISRHEPFLVQEALVNHRDIGNLGAGALSTVRVLSCRNERGDFEVTNAAFRMSVDRGSPVDNFHAGGIASAVDIATGALGFATDLGTRRDSEWHEDHPVTKARIVDRTLPLWQDVKDLAVRAHRAFGDYVLIGWDIAILDDGPCLVEGNRGPDLDIIQRTLDAPIGSARFGELLAFNLERCCGGRR